MVSGEDTLGLAVISFDTEVEPVAEILGAVVVSDASLEVPSWLLVTPPDPGLLPDEIPASVVPTPLKVVASVLTPPGEDVVPEPVSVVPGVEFSGPVEIPVDLEVAPTAVPAPVAALTSVGVVAFVLKLPGATVVPTVTPVITILIPPWVVSPLPKDVVAPVLELPDATVVPETTRVIPVLLPGLVLSDGLVVAPVLELPGKRVLPKPTAVVPV